MAREVERKYLGADFARLRNLLAAHAGQSGGVHFESNVLFDTGDSALYGSGRLLRLRSRRWANREDHVLTCKLPHPAATSGPEAGFKIREERECRVEDACGMRAILEGLGYAVMARYEKFRESWRLDAVSVDMDILPFAQVVELEGDAGRIEKLEVLLKLDNLPTSTDSYHSLHQQWRAERHLPPERSFVFTPREAAQWRAVLGLPPEED